MSKMFAKDNDQGEGSLCVHDGFDIVTIIWSSLGFQNGWNL